MTRVYGLRLKSSGAFVYWTGIGWSWSIDRVKPFGTMAAARDEAGLQFDGLNAADECEVIEV